MLLRGVDATEPDTMAIVFFTHRALHGAALARGLADVLAMPPADPFAAEVVAVPAKGVERWIAQRLSHVLGDVGGRRRLRERRVPVAEHAGRRGAWPRRRPSTRRLSSGGRRAGQCGRCSTSSTHAIPPSRGPARWPSTSAPTPRTRADGSRVAAPPRRRCSTSTGSPGPRCCAPGPPAGTSAATAAPLDADLAWQAELWRRLRDTPRHPEPGRAARRRLRAGCGPSRR